MKTHAIWQRALAALALLLLGNGAALGYAVGRPVKLEKLTNDATCIFKGTAVASKMQEDAEFKPLPGYAAHETEFKIVSVIKGEKPADNLKFRHYDDDPKSSVVTYSPQFYHFEPGRTYLVFAKKSATGGVFQQMWLSHTGMADEGALLCADDKPLPAHATVKEIIWAELTALLKSADGPDVRYAIAHLDQLSGDDSDADSSFDKLAEFDCKAVLAAVRGCLTQPEPETVHAALMVIGGHNPYLRDDPAQFWLATVGAVETPGIGKWDPTMNNVGGKLYWEDLAAIADGKADAATRALAVRALGLVREPRLQKPVERWLADPAPEVRASAALLLADFPKLATRERLGSLAADPAPSVRAATAYAIGYSQRAAGIDTLTTLLADPDKTVRRAALLSLLSFSPKDKAVAAAFRANLKNQEFAPLFLLALARDRPGDYLEELAEIVEKQTAPENWGGGQIPAYTAWHMLHDFLHDQPRKAVASGKFDRVFTALEADDSGRYSSSEPRDTYALYLQFGMTDRAQKFRQRANKAARYDLDYYFKQVDDNPPSLKRE